MKKQGLKSFLNMILIIVLGAVAATLLMTLVYMVPVNSAVVTDTTALFQKEGWYPKATNPVSEDSAYFNSYEPDVLDNRSDKVMVSTALDETAKGSAIMRAMKAYNDYLGIEYAYYWHGYSIILRPLMFFFDLGLIRCINAILQVFLVGLLAKALWDKKGWRYALMAISSYILLHPIALAKSLQFSWVFYIGIIGSIVVAKHIDAFEKTHRYLYLFTIVGMATSFFDLLTYPLFTWGCVAVVFLTVSKEERTVWQYLVRVVHTGLAWILGYAGMWVMKWTIGSLITQSNIFKTAVLEVFLRTGVGNGDANIQVFGIKDRIALLYQNWKHYDNDLYAIVLVAWVALVVIASIRKGVTKSAKIPALFLVAASAFVWYVVLANHTALHHFFTYRIFAVTILAGMAIALISTENSNVLPKRESFKMLGIWIGLAAIAVAILLTCVRESVQVSNGGEVPRHILLEPEGKMEVTFTPTYSGIREFMLCTNSESTEGYYKVSVLQDGKEVHVETFHVSEFATSSFRSFKVNWDVKAGRQYDIIIEAIDTNADVYAVITEDGKLPLQEYANLRVNGKGYESQPSSGFTYWCLPPNGRTNVLVIAFMMAAMACVLITIKNKTTSK